MAQINKIIKDETDETLKTKDEIEKYARTTVSLKLQKKKRQRMIKIKKQRWKYRQISNG